MRELDISIQNKNRDNSGESFRPREEENYPRQGDSTCRLGCVESPAQGTRTMSAEISCHFPPIPLSTQIPGPLQEQLHRTLFLETGTHYVA